MFPKIALLLLLLFKLLCKVPSDTQLEGRTSGRKGKERQDKQCLEKQQKERKRYRGSTTENIVLPAVCLIA
jgi:hypothetical protein